MGTHTGRFSGLCVFLVPALSHYRWVVGVGAHLGWAFKHGEHAVGFTFNTCWANGPQLVQVTVVVVWGGCVVCCL